MSDPIKLSVVDDDKLVVQLLAQYFNSLSDLEVISTAYGGNQLIEYLESNDNHPNIVVMDLRMKDGNGLETIQALASEYPTIRFIVLSSYYKPSIVGHLFKAGASAFVPKEIDQAELPRVIREVYQNGHFFFPDQLEPLRQQINASKKINIGEDTQQHLSKREVEVLELICQQLTAKEIAERLFVSTKTVEAHKSNLLAKTGAKNNTGLVIYAVQNAIVDPNNILFLE